MPSHNLWVHNSMVEYPAHNRAVQGSSPCGPSPFKMEKETEEVETEYGVMVVRPGVNNKFKLTDCPVDGCDAEFSQNSGSGRANHFLFEHPPGDLGRDMKEMNGKSNTKIWTDGGTMEEETEEDDFGNRCTNCGSFVSLRDSIRHEEVRVCSSCGLREVVGLGHNSNTDPGPVDTTRTIPSEWNMSKQSFTDTSLGWDSSSKNITGE